MSVSSQNRTSGRVAICSQWSSSRLYWSYLSFSTSKWAGIFWCTL